MKKNFNDSGIIIFIVVLPILILMTLFLIVYTPVDLIRYCFSNRRKNMKHLYGKQAKYHWLITLTDHYQLYELISKQHLPIQFIKQNENPCEHGYFYYDKYLFLYDGTPHYDADNDNWYIVHGHYESDLHEWANSEKAYFHKCLGTNANIECEQVIFLVKENNFSNEEKKHFESADFILTYTNKNFAEKITKLIKN